MRQIFASIAIFFMSQLGALSISTPVTLSLPEGGKPSCTSVSINEKGEAVVLWISQYFSDKMIEASTRSPTKEWSPPYLIGENLGYYNINPPKSLVDYEGNILCGWIGNVKEKCFFQEVKKEKNQSWSISQPVIFEDLIFFSFPFSSRVDFLFFDHKMFFKKMIIFNFQQQKKISQELPLGERASLRALSVSPEGKKFMVYSSTYSGYFSTSHMLKGISFEKDAKPVIISNLSSEYDYHLFQCAVNDKDQKGVIWCKCNGIEKYFEATICLDGKWSEPFNFVTGKEIQISNIAIDQEGNLLILWSKNSYQEKGLFAAYKPKGQPWLETVQLFKSTYLRVLKVEIKEIKGHFVVVWDQIAGRESSIHGATFSTASQNWSPSIQLSPSENSCAYPSMALNEQDNGIVAWEAIIEGRSCIQAADLNLD